MVKNTINMRKVNLTILINISVYVSKLCSVCVSGV